MSSRQPVRWTRVLTVAIRDAWNHVPAVGTLVGIGDRYCRLGSIRTATRDGRTRHVSVGIVHTRSVVLLVDAIRNPTSTLLEMSALVRAHLTVQLRQIVLWIAALDHGVDRLQERLRAMRVARNATRRVALLECLVHVVDASTDVVGLTRVAMYRSKKLILFAVVQMFPVRQFVLTRASHSRIKIRACHQLLSLLSLSPRQGRFVHDRDARRRSSFLLRLGVHAVRVLVHVPSSTVVAKV